MKSHLSPVLGLLCFSAPGCASKLVVKPATPNVFNGIPVRAPVSYVIGKEISYDPHPDTKIQCPSKIVEEITHLALGKEYDVNFVSAAFAKSEFSVTLNENGTLKTVSLNSTPQAAETIKSLAELVEKVAAPFKPLEVQPVVCGPVKSETIKYVRKLEITQ